MKAIKTYSEFWPFYLREHSKPATRGWHYVGTAIGLGILVFAIFTARWWMLPLMLVAGYFFAWMSHATVEKNRPATFTYPFWSFISDFKMFFCFLTGQMPKELEKAGVTKPGATSS
ncbi:Mpo1-like protein [Litorimonas sp.]|jgi:hypothetical protein|uniref:Mpo1-like protein n=1 Tax=Litorimonas sp. TaxID=1892381 RepID=UPI003A84DAA2